MRNKRDLFTRMLGLKRIVLGCFLLNYWMRDPCQSNFIVLCKPKDLTESHFKDGSLERVSCRLTIVLD